MYDTPTSALCQYELQLDIRFDSLHDAGTPFHNDMISIGEENVADQQNEGFVRQRRNLMIVSLVLLFSEATELRVEKISAFGTELLVGQPQAVTMALWVAAVYWLVRFYQYSGAVFPNAIENIIQNQVNYKTCQKVAIKRLIIEEPSLLEPINNIKTKPTIDYSSLSILASNRKYLKVKLELKKTASDEHSSATQGLGDRIIQIDGADLFWLRFRALINLTLHTTLFTELVLPYIVFSLPVLYVGFKAIR